MEVAESLERAVRWLWCPHCYQDLSVAERAVVCDAGHSFDIARQGYVNLLARPTKLHADTATMTGERADFLAAGHYAPIADALASAARRLLPPAPTGLAADIGGGTGYYHAAVLEQLPGMDGLLFDLSKFAARRAARAHPRIAAGVADVWQPLPLRDGAATLLLNTFAPRNGPELRRVLSPAGALLVVTPEADHLRELTARLGLLRVDEAKQERVAQQLAPFFTVDGTEGVTRAMVLDHRAMGRLIGMGPNAWHQQPGELTARLAELPDAVTVTLNVTVTAYRPR